MTTARERILLVESDPEICDLIARQTLQPMGYRVEVTGAAAQAIQEAVAFSPDLIMANLNLPGLSGKDLLVALSSQGIDVPIIVLAEKGQEGEVIQAFRLGASDFIHWPVREAEIIQAVERVLKQVRAKGERETLARQLKQTNQELQRRVRELTTIFAIGKAVTSVTDQKALLEKIVEGAVYVTEADSGWLLLRDDRSKTYVLSACRNLPKPISEKIGQPWDDGISSLVALSGEPLSIHGEPLKRFKVSRLGQAALVVPVKAKKEVVGLLIVVRAAAQPFGSSNQTLLEAVADYASISLVNARLFKVLEERARTLQQAADSAKITAQVNDDLLHSASRGLRGSLDAALGQVDLLMGEQRRNLSGEQSKCLRIAQENLKYLNEVLQNASTFEQGEITDQLSVVELNDIARKSVTQFQGVARQTGVTLISELCSSPAQAWANPFLVAKLFQGLISNAIKFCNQGGQVTVRIEISDGHPLVTVKDNGIGMDKETQQHIFDRNFTAPKPGTPRFGGLGIRLPQIKDIVTFHGGKIWLESEPGKGASFHFTLLPSVGL